MKSSNLLVGTRSQVYSTVSFETEVGDQRRRGPAPGDVFTSSKYPGQPLLCIDNCVRVRLDGKRDCSVVGLTDTGKLLVSTPTGVNVLGTRAHFSCFGGITSKMVNATLESHYLWITQHLSKAAPPETADVEQCHSAQVPPHLPSPQHPTNCIEPRLVRCYIPTQVEP
jgi:hypothetical protein